MEAPAGGRDTLFSFPPFGTHTHKLPAKFVGGGNRPGKRARIPEQKGKESRLLVR